MEAEDAKLKSLIEQDEDLGFEMSEPVEPVADEDENADPVVLADPEDLNSMVNSVAAGNDVILQELAGVHQKVDAAMEKLDNLLETLLPFIKLTDHRLKNLNHRTKKLDDL